MSGTPSGRDRAELLRARARAFAAIRRFFAEREFVEVDTPLVVHSPGLDLHVEAHPVPGLGWLITSPEYAMKRLLAEGLERILQLGHVFRRDEQGRHHEPEFTLLEWYRMHAGSEDLIVDTEALIEELAEELLGAPTLRVAGGEGEAPLEIDLRPPFARLRVDEALRRFAGVALEDLLSDEERFYRVWIEAVEPRLRELGAVFITHFPASMASLARLLPDEPAFADRFELYLAGIEICNGFGELVDPLEQRARLERDRLRRETLGLPAYPIDERFLAALESGIPPSGGNALGVDRLLMLFFGASTVGEVMAFDSECR